ncbi:MAG: hypothetical protein ACXWRZ_05815 [Bdellovibrio sp.]
MILSFMNRYWQKNRTKRFNELKKLLNMIRFIRGKGRSTITSGSFAFSITVVKDDSLSRHSPVISIKKNILIKHSIK